LFRRCTQANNPITLASRPFNSKLTFHQKGAGGARGGIEIIGCAQKLD
jgi:hypothetical protein